MKDLVGKSFLRSRFRRRFPTFSTVKRSPALYSRGINEGHRDPFSLTQATALRTPVTETVAVFFYRANRTPPAKRT